MEEKMELKFCSLSSGSSGNCQYIETEKTRLIVDAGLSGRQIEFFLKSIGVDPRTLDGILVTHEHMDHIKGVGILSRRYDLPIYANQNTWIEMERFIGEVKEKNIKIFDTDKHFSIKDIDIHPIKVFHDAREPVGYIFYYKKLKISMVTDTGYVSDPIKSSIKGSNLYLLESNHDIDMLKNGSYPWYLKQRILSTRGHLSNEDAGKILGEIISGKGEVVLLGHLSKENNTETLAYKTVKEKIEKNGISVNKDIILDLTHRDRPSKVYCLK